MRRDYFICVCLTCIALSLIFICIAPADFGYGKIEGVSCSIFSFILSLIFTVFVLIILPICSAIKRKIWIMWGLVFYGFIVYIPLIVMPRIELNQGKSSLFSKIIYEVLDSLYVVTNAPFAPLSRFFGSNFAFHLSTKIMPMALLIYFVFHLYRFYKKAYLAEKLNPLNQMDAVDKAKMRNIDETPKEVIGTVVTAPDGDKKSVVQELFNVFDKEVRKPATSGNNIPSSGDTKPLSTNEIHDMSEKYRRERVYTSEIQKQKMDNKFRAYIAKYEKDNNVKISADERKRLYSKFVKLYTER